MIGTMDPSLVALFTQVAESGGVRLAAQRLGLPRSTVSRKLAELEAHLGTRLLQRSTRAMTLTEEGAVLLERARPALTALSDAESAVRALRARPTGTLRLSAPPFFAEHFLPPVLERYARRYPDVKLDLCLDDKLLSLVDEGIDCAVRAGPLSNSNLIARKLSSGSQRAYASPDYLRARGEPAHPRELSAHETIAFTGRRQPNRWSFIVGDEKLSVTVAPKHRANSMLLVRDMARASMGIALLPTFLCADNVQRGELREVLSGFASPARSMYLVYPSERHLAEKTRAFIALVTAHFEANVPMR
jgi:DNA-binding transcriptional LysR family regulator